MNILFLVLALTAQAASMTAAQMRGLAEEAPNVEKCIDRLRVDALEGRFSKTYVPGPCGDYGIASDCGQVTKSLEKLGYKVTRTADAYKAFHCEACCDAVTISWKGKGKKK